MKNLKNIVYLASIVAFLNACSSDKDKPFIFDAPCVRPMVVGELSEMVHQGTTEKDPSYAAAITNVWAKCEKKENQNQEHAVLFTRFLIKRSQAGTEQEIKVPYFVVLVDKEENLFFKKEAIVIASYGKKQKRALPVGEIELNFQLPTGHSLDDLNLLVGLQVDDMQLEKNINKRQKVVVSSRK